MASDHESSLATSTFLGEVVENLYNCIAVSEAVRRDGQVVDFRCIYVNRAYEQHAGYTREEVLSKTLLERFPTMVESGLFDRLVQVVETGEPLDIEYETKSDGLNMFLRLVAKKFGDGCLIAFHDIARRKRGETELKRVNQELEARVEIRTAELRKAQESIQQALDESLRSNSAKSEFLAMVSHDLRSPLTAIQGYVGLLVSEGLGEEQVKQLNVVDQCAEGLLRLLDDLLRFSRLEAGQFTLENEPFLLPELVMEAMDIFRPAAHQKNLGLRAELDAALPKIVVGDPAQLRRILTNLIGNALKFTQQGEVVVKLRATAREPATAGWALHGEVVDTGPGMDARQVQRLFMPYAQGVGAARRNNAGVGLGLAICRRLCELMGGKIGYCRTPSSGSCFCFQLQFGAPDDEWKYGA